MISDIHNSWPPIFGSENVGNKTILRKIAESTHSVLETLVGLHEPAWWTGIRVSAPRDDGFEGPVRISINLNHMSWTQPIGELGPFPFPIPARLATEQKLDVAITIDDYVGPIAICISFQEMTGLPVRDKYVFARPDGSLVMTWDGATRSLSTPDVGVDPIWRTIHYVVPMMQELIEGTNTLPSMSCIHDWADTVNS